MDAPHIDDLVAQVLAWHHRHRLAARIAAQLVSGVRPAAMSFWRRPRVVVAVLSLSACPAMATAVASHTPHAATPKAGDAHAEVVVPVSPPVSSSPDAVSSDLPAMPALNVVPGHARPHIRPVLSDEVRLAALQEGKRLRSMDPGAVMAALLRPPPVGATSVKALTTTNVPADGAAVYALVTDITHTRIASELRQQLMGSSATVGELPGTPRTELMQVSAGWRAVVWPFATESEADKARRMLAERGIRTELLKF